MITSLVPILDVNRGNEIDLSSDINPLDKPWAYYQILGISKDATYDEIKRAYRKLAMKTHSDREGGNDEDFKQIALIKNVLLDDGGELGSEYSLRTEYDEICSLSSTFTQNISRGENKTQRLTEILLEEMRTKRKIAEIDVDIDKTNPGFRELKIKTEEKIDAMKELKAEIGKIKRQLERGKITRNEGQTQLAALQTAAEKTIETIQSNAQTLNATIKARFQISDEHREELSQKEKSKLETFHSDFQRNPSYYHKKLLDVFYTGPGKFQFGISNKVYFEIENYEFLGELLKLNLMGDCYLSGFSQVHFKSSRLEQLLVTDSNLKGLIEIVNGDVKIKYKSAKGYNVIKAQTLDGEIKLEGFAKEGDLYIPEQYATKNWQNQKPHLEILVKTGDIDLTQIRKVPENVYSIK